MCFHASAGFRFINIPLTKGNHVGWTNISTSIERAVQSYVDKVVTDTGVKNMKGNLKY